MNSGRAIKTVVIEAGNIRGLGSVSVCQNLIPQLIQSLNGSKCNIELHASDRLLLQLELSSEIYRQIKIIAVGTGFFKKVWGLLRYIRTFRLDSRDSLIVLGDIPFKTNAQQTIFVQQYNVVSPKIDGMVVNSLKFRLMRWIFTRNLKFVSKIVVQTESFKLALTSSYKFNSDMIAVVRHQLPAAGLVRECPNKVRGAGMPVVFYYPSSFYNYKNHKIIWSVLPKLGLLGLNVRFDLTILESEIPQKLRGSKFLRCLGPLSADAALKYYGNADFLFFPSKVESYGLPLAEALYLAKIPVLAADRPYSRELCGKYAKYFDPESADNLLVAMTQMIGELSVGVRGKDADLPKLETWESMAQQLILY